MIMEKFNRHIPESAVVSSEVENLFVKVWEDLSVAVLPLFDGFRQEVSVGFKNSTLFNRERRRVLCDFFFLLISNSSFFRSYLLYSDRFIFYAYFVRMININRLDKLAPLVFLSNEDTESKYFSFSTFFHAINDAVKRYVGSSSFASPTLSLDKRYDLDALLYDELVRKDFSLRFEFELRVLLSSFNPTLRVKYGSYWCFKNRYVLLLGFWDKHTNYNEKGLSVSEIQAFIKAFYNIYYVEALPVEYRDRAKYAARKEEVYINVALDFFEQMRGKYYLPADFNSGDSRRILPESPYKQIEKKPLAVYLQNELRNLEKLRESSEKVIESINALISKIESYSGVVVSSSNRADSNPAIVVNEVAENNNTDNSLIKDNETDEDKIGDDLWL